MKDGRITTSRVAREFDFLKIDDRRAKPLSRADRRSFSLAAPALSETSPSRAVLHERRKIEIILVPRR
jgi:hypothetical protein